MKAFIAAMLVAGPVHAVSVPLYTPGAAPCSGACSLEWARGETDTPAGQPVPMIVPKGSIVEWMSYANDGTPHAQSKPMAFAEDESGIGYWFEDENGDRKLMFRLDECQNWSVVQVPFTLDAAPPEALMGATPWRNETLGTPPVAQASRFSDEPCCYVAPPPIAPTPVPLPASAFLLIMALSGPFLLAGLLLALARLIPETTEKSQ